MSDARSNLQGKSMLRERLMWIAWPAFMVAAVLEMMVFAVLDPDTLSLFGERVGWSRYAVYTVTFFIFWGMMMVSSGLTALLGRSSVEMNQRDLHVLPEPRRRRSGWLWMATSACWSCFGR